MSTPSPTMPPWPAESDHASGWSLVRAAAAAAEAAAAANRPAPYARVAATGLLRELAPEEEGGLLAWEPGTGWRCLLPPQDCRQAVADLYLPLCAAHAARPITVAHLGQSLDGFIATGGGDSYYVTGPANILHLHRLRALCDAVVVGAETVLTDNPRLTARLATGPNPLRVVLDPSRRLPATHHVFSDGAASTVRACLAPNAAFTPGAADLVVAERGGRLDLADLVRQLRARGCSRIFIEGGGVTVSAFLQAGLLDRLQVAIASLLIGEGRPALMLPGREPLAHCVRPAARLFRMGEDILYDCDLAASTAAPAAAAPTGQSLQRLF